MRKLNDLDLDQLALSVHQANEAKGFWETDRPPGETLMLVVSELYEALEVAETRTPFAPSDWFSYVQSFEERDDWTGFFRYFVKDTVPCELADVVIRILDMAGRYGIPIGMVCDKALPAMPGSSQYDGMPGDLEHFVLRMTQYICKALEELRQEPRAVWEYPQNLLEPSRKLPFWGYLAFVMKECDFFARKVLEVPLSDYVEAKLKYNATRPHKHGKAF